MRLLFRLLTAAAVTASVAPARAVTALDTTGTVYSTDRVVVALTFPAVGPTSFTDTFLACRSGCTRKHMGQDLMGPKMSPVVAACDGTVASLKREQSVGEGNSLALACDHGPATGWTIVYIHLNNDTPGTDDGLGTANFAVPKGIEVGTRVLAGQLVAWRGDSGSAESTGPHVHFELRKGFGWGGTVYNAYPSLLAARHIAAPTASGPHPDRSLLRSSSGALFVTDGALKRPVSPGVLAANGLSAAQAIFATSAEFLLYKTGPALTLRDGVLAQDADGGLWRVLGSTRFPVSAAPGQRVFPVSATDLAGLAVVEAPAAVLTSGVVVRVAGLVYVVSPDGLLQQVTAYTMTSWGLTNADAIDLPADVPVEIGDPLGPRDGTLVNIGGVGAAVVSGGVVRRLWDAREIAAYGYGGKPRLNVPASLVFGLPTGEIAGTTTPFDYQRR